MHGDLGFVSSVPTARAVLSSSPATEVAGYYQRSLRDLQIILVAKYRTLDRRGLLPSLRLDLDVNVHQGNRGGRHAGNAGSMTEGAGTDLD